MNKPEFSTPEELEELLRDIKRAQEPNFLDKFCLALALIYLTIFIFHYYL